MVDVCAWIIETVEAANIIAISIEMTLCDRLMACPEQVHMHEDLFILNGA